MGREARTARDLADLVKMPGWGGLVELLNKLEIDLLDRIYAAEEDDKILAAAREWRLWHRWTMVVKGEPERLADELERALAAVEPTSPFADPFRGTKLNTYLRSVQDDESKGETL